MSAVYELRLRGHLDDHWSPRLDGLALLRHPDGTSTLTGALADQARLHGVLAAVRDIGAPLLSLRIVDHVDTVESRAEPKESASMAEPPVVDVETWRRELADLRAREKAATKELDAIAAQRRRLPMVRMPEYTLVGADGPVRLVDVFAGRSQLIVYNHMWEPGAEWQCGGCTSFTSSFTRLGFLDNYDARFVVVTQGPIDDALAYAQRVGNTMDWYSTADSTFGSDVDAPPGGGFAINIFLRHGDDVHRTWYTSGRGVEQLTYTFTLADVLPFGRQEEWQDSPDGRPQSPAYSGWLDSPDIARLYGRG
ncbi:DUF899 family protein [Pseudonocardia sp. N23]|uniref:DUF899 family protein n=1 Tax=Pseudonocardia sp. N23 TaxID=1987376 RepID=UPI00209BC966|nr:DUF899 family protein [Pseudonocardia sp. N23]